MTDYEITEDGLENDESLDGWWNYRLIRKDGMISIHECYYDSNGKIWACSVEPETVSIEDDGVDPAVDSLRNMLDWMKLALDKPILNYNDIPEEDARKL